MITMKNKLALALLGVIGLLSSTLNAQPTYKSAPSLSESIKILPTEKTNIIKVLYAMESESPVEIKFITFDGEVGTDKVFRTSYEKGFSKRYDISKITSRKFHVQVTTPEASVVYRIERSKDGETFTPYLEKATRSEIITASKKN